MIKHNTEELKRAIKRAGGIEKVALALNLKSTITVDYWIQGKRWPSRNNLEKILSLSNTVMRLKGND